MIQGLAVNGEQNPGPVASPAPTFSWHGTENETQFTFQLSPLPSFAYIAVIRDTRNEFYTYDGGRMHPSQTYFWRVRSGLGPWAYGSFTTAEGLE